VPASYINILPKAAGAVWGPRPNETPPCNQQNKVYRAGFPFFNGGSNVARIIEASGASIEEAIQIIDADHHMDGVQAEYLYLEEKFGTRGKDWHLKQQLLILEPTTERMYDMMELEFPDGREETIIFDIHSFFNLE
jgi:hypothetical protein